MQVSNIFGGNSKISGIVASAESVAANIANVSIPDAPIPVAPETATVVVDTVNTTKVDTPPHTTTHTSHTHTETNNWDKPFWRSVFSGDNGGGSTSRVGTLFVVLVSELQASYLIAKIGNVPPNLMKLGWFSALLICVVYAPAKFMQAIQSYFAKKKA